MSIARRTSGSVAAHLLEPAPELGPDELRDHAAGDLAGVVAAHAVGQHRERVRFIDRDRVLVVRPRATGVRGTKELDRRGGLRHGGGDKQHR
jgi:hypothetical protein